MLRAAARDTPVSDTGDREHAIRDASDAATEVAPGATVVNGVPGDHRCVCFLIRPPMRTQEPC
jgi:hypothetical protein